MSMEAERGTLRPRRTHSEASPKLSRTLRREEHSEASPKDLRTFAEVTSEASPKDLQTFAEVTSEALPKSSPNIR